MGLPTSVYQFGRKAWFMRDGTDFTLPSPGVSARESKPDGNDPAFVEIGLIESLEDDVSGGQDLEVWRGAPYHLELYEARQIKSKQMYKFTSGELSAFAHEIFYRASQIMDEDTDQFNPGSAQLRKGWLHIEDGDADTDELARTFDLYGRLQITGGMKSEETGIVKPTWEFLKLYSTQNTAGFEL